MKIYLSCNSEIMIKGEKIYLKKDFSKEGYKELFRWFTDIEVMSYVGFAKRTLSFKKVEEAELFTKELEDGIFFEIYNKNGQIIGYTSLSHFKGRKECEFGIFIGDKIFWNKGVGFEASHLTLRYAFEKLKVNKVVLSTSGLHKSAIRLYEKVGFTIYEVKKDARQVYHNNEWVKSDTVLMVISKGMNGWPKKKHLSSSFIA